MSINWRSSGDVDLATWTAAIPIASEIRQAGEVADCWQAARPYSRLALGMLAAESSFATDFSPADPASNKNALNMRPRGGLPGFQAFSSWQAGIGEWRDRITSLTYAYKDTQTVADLIAIYAPASENNVSAYVATVETIIARLTPAPTPGGNPVTFPSYPVAGLATPIVLPVPLVQSLIPAGQTNQRPGIARQTPGLFVVHETANTNTGADADMHARYLANGADGSQVSWHFSVDDHHIVQHIPISEVTWQSADGSGPGNMSGVSCELCVNSDGNEALTRRNAEALVGTICAALRLTVDQIKRHWDMNAADPNRHHCPDHMMTENYWPQFVANAGVVIAANTPGVTPTPMPVPTPVPVPVPAPTPVPVPKPVVTYPPSLDRGVASDLFGTFGAWKYVEGMPLSALWLAHGTATGSYGAIVNAKSYIDSPTTTRRIWQFSDGTVIAQDNASAPLHVLKAA